MPKYELRLLNSKGEAVKVYSFESRNAAEAMIYMESFGDIRYRNVELRCAETVIYRGPRLL